MGLIRVFSFSIFLVAMVVQGPVCASMTDFDANHIFAFADYLEQTGDYYRAITEYRRLVFHWPNHPLASESRYRIGRSYLRGQDYQSALYTFQNLFYQDMPDFDHRRLRYAIAQSFFYQQNYFQANQQLAALENFPLSDKVPPLSYSRLWCFLRPGDVDEALEFWNQLPQTTTDAIPKANAIQRYLNEMADQPLKNPRLAGWLSAALPGLGQVYAGRPRNAIMSFLINGLFIGGIAAAIDKGNYETAAVLGFFEIGFYTANIYNAVNDAHKTNRSRTNVQLVQFEQRFGPPFEYDYAPFNP